MSEKFGKIYITTLRRKNGKFWTFEDTNTMRPIPFGGSAPEPLCSNFSIESYGDEKAKKMAVAAQQRAWRKSNQCVEHRVMEKVKHLSGWDEVLDFYRGVEIIRRGNLLNNPQDQRCADHAQQAGYAVQYVLSQMNKHKPITRTKSEMLGEDRSSWLNRD